MKCKKRTISMYDLLAVVEDNGASSVQRPGEMKEGMEKLAGSVPRASD